MRDGSAAIAPDRILTDLSGALSSYADEDTRF